MKKTILVLLACCTVMSILGCTVSAKGESWYFKKKGSELPTCGVSKDFLKKTNSFWLDNTSENKKIYLTFDVGYVNENVLSVLDALKEENVTGAFFILGHPVLKNTDTVKRMKDEGHLVCNHTKNHKDISEMTKEEFTKNLTDLEKIYEEKTGYTLDKFFRPPEGKYSEQSLLWAKELGYKNVFWSYAYADWDDKSAPSPEKALSKLCDNAHSGEILLLHPTSCVNAKIIKSLIQKLKADGYTFGSLNELTQEMY